MDDRDGRVKFKWTRDGNHLATSGANGLVHIFNRHGATVKEVSLGSGACLALDWDRDGDCLAILQEGSGRVPIYSLSTRKKTVLDTSLKDPTFLKWSRNGPHLAIGTMKGNLLLYNKLTCKKVPVLGKHSRRIVCGAWSADNRLALGSDDRTLTLSTCDGDTIEQTEVKYEPLDIQFAAQKTTRLRKGGGEGKAGDDNESTISINMGGRTILLYNLNEPDNPIELAFQQRYGSIVAYRWFGDGYLLIGFSEGYVVAISTHIDEIGEELFSGKFHKGQLRDIAVCPVLNRAATCGDGCIRIVDMKNWKELKSEAVHLDREHGNLDKMEWTEDGQILTVGTRNGRIYNFLARMAAIHDCQRTRVAHLSSLRELSVVDPVQDRGRRADAIRISVNVEPSFVALGHRHVAVGMNNRAWFYECAYNSANEQVNEQEYLGTVDEIRLNGEWAAVLCEGKVYLHAIEPPHSDRRDSYGVNTQEIKIFPGGGKDVGTLSGVAATCVALTDHLLIYGTADGIIEYYSLGDQKVLDGCHRRHDIGVKYIFPNQAGTRIVYVDVAGQGFLYNPVTTQVIEIPCFGTCGVKHVMWDAADWGVFVAADATDFHTYVYSPLTINGPVISKVGPLEVRDNGDMRIDEKQRTPIPPGLEPILTFNGRVICQAQNGQLDSVLLSSHDLLDDSRSSGHMSGDRLRREFAQNLALLRLKPAWNIALQMMSYPHWLALSGKAMEQLDVGMAIRVYRQLGDAGMVMGLEDIEHIEDKHLLAGHVSLLFGKYAKAQELFLMSSSPETALNMRRDLLQWEPALKLAEQLAPAELPEICIQYAQQLEFKGDFHGALSNYAEADRALRAMPTEQVEAMEMVFEERRRTRQLNGQNVANGVGGGDTNAQPQSTDKWFADLQRKCTHGSIRMKIRTGDVQNGADEARRSRDKRLCKECAAILVDMSQYAEAAPLYVEAEEWDAAATIYIKIAVKTRDFSKVDPLMKHITIPKLHLQYAKAKEAAKSYEEAAKAYQLAKDLDSVVRLSLEKLNQPQRAYAIVRRTMSAAAADMCARYCRQNNDFALAIEFLLLAKRSKEAFELATERGKVELYATALGGDGSPEEYRDIARYYESRGEWGKAGEFYSVCGQYHKALKLFLQCGETEMDKAIDVVGKARSDMLTHTLIDFLMGEADGVPKDPNYIFRLYMALGNYAQAAKTALIIARQEQELGNYKVAHNILLETHRDLSTRGFRVPQALRSAFLLLHSYLLVKKLVKMGDHTGAARMLIRVAKNISKFPSHVVPILTSTVIECQRAKLKRSSFEYASMLMRPEYRETVDPKFKRKIEAIVRKKGKGAVDVPEEMSPCPYTGIPIGVTELVCPKTKNAIPFCVVSGLHMVVDDWCICPNSKMPALFSRYQKYLETHDTDPVFGKSVNVCDLELVHDKSVIDDMLRRTNNNTAAKKKES